MTWINGIYVDTPQQKGAYATYIYQKSIMKNVKSEKKKWTAKELLEEATKLVNEINQEKEEEDETILPPSLEDILYCLIAMEDLYIKHEANGRYSRLQKD